MRTPSRPYCRLLPVTVLCAALLGACGDGPTATPRGDTTAPVVVIDAPARDTILPPPTQYFPERRVHGVASDSVGVTRVTYQLNGTTEQEVPVTPGPSVAYTFAVDLHVGENTLVVHAYDAAGNRGSSPARRLVMDAAGPTLSMPSPQDLAVVTSDTVRVTFRVSDPGGVLAVYLSLNGVVQKLEAGDTAVEFSLVLPLKPGGNVLTLQAQDRAFNTTSLARTLYRKDLAFRSVAVQREHACALTPEGKAYCWGSNWNGALGIGVRSYDSYPGPTPVVGGHTFRSLTAGSSFTCGLDTAGAAYCWGYNHEGALGIPAHGTFDAPVAVAGGLAFREISSGREHTCGVTPGDVAYCWGGNPEGQLGTGGGKTRTPAPVAGGLSFRAIRAGAVHTCALTPGGKAYCWGFNDYGQVGDGTRSDVQIPVEVAGGRTFVAIAPGLTHTCALDADGAAYCWGSNLLGELGTGGYQSGTTPTLAPVPVSGGHTFAAISAGDGYTCALDVGGDAWCWGDNTYGQFGTGDRAGSAAPRRVAGGHRFRGLETRVWRTCAVTVDDTLYCWGSGPVIPTPVTGAG